MLHTFVFCDICLSILPRIDVILLKNAAKYNVGCKRLHEQISELSSKLYEYAYPRIIQQFVNICNICFNSR